MTAKTRRLVVVSELWNHYAAAVLRSRIPYAIIPTDRGTRIAGKPTMNWTAKAATTSNDDHEGKPSSSAWRHTRYSSRVELTGAC